MVTFTEEILNRKLHFLCSKNYKFIPLYSPRLSTVPFPRSARYLFGIPVLLDDFKGINETVFARIKTAIYRVQKQPEVFYKKSYS